jgi:hypothetical protein
MHGIESYSALPKQKKHQQEHHEEPQMKKSQKSHVINLMMFKAMVPSSQHML